MPALEIFANNAQCKLAAPIDAIQTTITVTPPLNVGFPFPSTGNFRILIDNEDLLVTGVAGLVWTVVRGVEVATTPAAAAAPHAAGALVSQITTSGGFVQAILDRVVWNVSAGVAVHSVTAFDTLVFSNSNGVSFGINGSTITASVAAGGAGNINVSAGTTSNLLTAFTFSDAHGVSFGLNGSTMTASIATSLTAINVSAGTTSQNLSAFTFSNANNVSFGLNGSTITASVAAASGTVGTITAFSQDADFVTNFVAEQAVLSLQKL
ncbi:MAG: hypothetical protein ACHREM_21020, partial [Polyangiales bacterium]